MKRAKHAAAKLLRDGYFLSKCNLVVEAQYCAVEEKVTCKMCLRRLAGKGNWK